jgi:hypothetical protein
MNKISLICLLLVSMASGCTHVISQTQNSDFMNPPTSSPNPLTPNFTDNSQNQATKTRSTQTPTNKPLNTLSITSSPIQVPGYPIALPLNNKVRFNISPEMEDLNLQGIIWIRHDWESGRYLQIDLENGDAKITPVIVSGYAELLPMSNEALYKSGDQTHLINMLTKEVSPLPITSKCWDAPSPNGRFLAFEECKPSIKGHIAQVLDLDTMIARPIARFNESRENRPWNTDPFLSFDGNHLVIQNGDGIFEISEDNNYKKLTLDQPFRATWDMAWSPAENLLLFGATDRESEIGYSINHLFLYNADTGETTLLYEVRDNQEIKSFLLQEVWSPDGKRLVFILNNYEGNEITTIDLCILTIDPIKADCQPIANNGENILNPAWSPDSKYLVFERSKRDTNTIRITVYPIELETPYTLLRIYPDTQYFHYPSTQRMFWRTNE